MKSSNLNKMKYVDLMKMKCFNCIPSAFFVWHHSKQRNAQSTDFSRSYLGGF